MKKIKTVEEYLQNVNSLTTRKELYDIGKQIQLDMLEYAVNKCAENAEVKIEFVSTGDYSGFQKEVVDKQSILKTIDEIKKELE